MRYVMPIRVRYSETDRDGKINLHKILEYFQDCCIFQSESLGYKVQDELDRDRGWFLLAWNLEIRRFPSMGEELQIVTEPYKMKGFYGYRRFFMIDGDNKEIASADSLWLLMNLQKKVPRRIPDDMIKAYISDVADDTVRVRRKLESGGEWIPGEKILVNRHYLDTNSHVNNVFYGMWAEKYLPEGFPIHKVKIDYRQSAFEQDVITVDTILEEDRLRCRFRNQEDILLALVELDRRIG
ncbi:MAG: acyl-[Eubacterium sp.]|nr:acyl-[acyl-carrier-protein] thioesterase [Eubacterium sp.]